MGFDPDKYLAEKAVPVVPSAPPSPGRFDPDAYLAAKTGAADPPVQQAGLLGGLAGQVGDLGAQLGSYVGGKALDAAKKLDSYTGAPVRSAIGALQDQKGLTGAVDAYRGQFGEDAEKAPTGKEIAAKAGLDDKTSMSQRFPGLFDDGSDTKAGIHPFRLKAHKGGLLDFTPAGAAGLGIDVAADPTLIAGKALGLVKGLKPVDAALEAGKNLAVKTGARVGEALTGVSRNEIKTYVTNLKEINGKIAKYGDDLASASDDVRAKFASDIRQTRQALNGKISTSLKSASPDATIDVSKVTDALDKARSRLNPKFEKDQIAQLDELQKVVTESAPDGVMNLGDLFDLKQHLQDRASGAYMKSGQIFQPGRAVQQAAKQAGSEARKILNATSPEIAEANNQLSLLHDLENKMNKNLIAEGKPEAALMGAGSNPSGRNAKNLERLGKITGTDMKGTAEKLAAQRTFTSPPLIPVDTTGKSATRVGIGTAAGWLLGGPAGAALGGAVTSPSTLKGLINLGSAARNPISKKGYGAAMGAARGLIR